MHPNQMLKPHLLALFDAKLYSNAPPYPISKAEVGHSTEETYCSNLYSQPHSFGHNPKLVPTGECWHMDQVLN